MKKIVPVGLMLAALFILSVSSAVAMGSAPKEEPKYKLQILKMEMVGAPASLEATVPGKALIVSTGEYKDVKAALEARGYKVTLTAKAGKYNAKDFDLIVVVGPKLGSLALKGLQ